MSRAPKTTTLTLWLRVENNSKFVRGKKRARENIERFHLERYGMKKLSPCEYELTFSYTGDEDLDRQVMICFKSSAMKPTCVIASLKPICGRKGRIDPGEFLAMGKAGKIGR